eukprot:2411870-Ditylum_brightwellii.AAC.1
MESQQLGVGSLPYKALTQLIKVYSSLWSSVPVWSLVNQLRTSPRLKKPRKTRGRKRKAKVSTMSTSTTTTTAALKFY